MDHVCNLFGAQNGKPRKMGKYVDEVHLDRPRKWTDIILLCLFYDTDIISDCVVPMYVG